jgi:hypothetical protein
MRLIIFSLLAVVSVGVVTANEAEADRYRRDNRSYNRPVYRDSGRRVYTGPVRANRRVYNRTVVHVNGGNYRFHNGTSVVYRRPYIARRYYDVRFRPQVIVENYPSQNGYIWVSGHWNWTGAEWNWIGGHYAPDPNIRTYYDDGSYE